MQVEQKSPRDELQITEDLAALSISNNPPSNNPPRKELVRTATVMVNRKYKETVNSNNETQEQLQIIMKKSRWICSIPIVIITKVTEIYNKLLQVGDEADIDTELKQAQREYDDYIPMTFDEFKGYQEEVLPIRVNEVDAVCKVKFKSFINKVMVDPGIPTFETLISRLRAEQKALMGPTVTENDMQINEVRLQTIEKQLMTLQQIRDLSVKFSKEMSDTKETNPHYKEYKEYFSSAWYGGLLKAAKKVPDEVIEKAKRVCTIYFQFYPKIICACSEFTKRIDLEFLEECNADSLYVQDMIGERERSAAVFESIIGELKQEESGWYTQYNSLDTLADKFSTLSEGHMQTLMDIDGYNEEKEKRINLGEDSYQDVWDACRRGGVADVKSHLELAKNSFDINTRRAVIGWTLLHFAVERGQKEIVAYLFTQGAQQFIFSKVQGKNISFTPLHLAAATCHEEIFTLCLQSHKQNKLAQVFGPSFIKKQDLNMPTKSQGGLSSYVLFHLIIQPTLLIPNPTEEHIKNWRTSAPTLVQKLLKMGASICVEGCKSAFTFAIDVLINDAKKEFATFSSIIEAFLGYSLSESELQDATTRLVRFFTPERSDDSEVTLFTKILGCDYFHTANGRKFVTELYKGTENSYFQSCMREILVDGGSPRSKESGSLKASSLPSSSLGALNVEPLQSERKSPRSEGKPVRLRDHRLSLPNLNASPVLSNVELLPHPNAQQKSRRTLKRGTDK